MKFENGFDRRPEVSVAGLLGRSYERHDLFEGEDMYPVLAKEMMLPFVRKVENRTDYLVSAPFVDGWGINLLLHAAAPAKYLGFETNDIKTDWWDLYEKPENKNRLEAHRRLPNWRYFEERRLELLELISRGAIKRKNPPYRHSFVIPVMSWSVDGDGRKQWDFELEQEKLAFLKKIHGGKVSERTFYPILGMLFDAAYAPDVTSNAEKWPNRRGYTGNPEDPKGTQIIGCAQTLPLVLINHADLLDSNLIKALEAHCARDYTFYDRLREMYKGVVI